MSAKKSASGTGTIRKKTVTRNGKPYTYWEARFTAGVDPGTGKQVQRSITGKTQREVARKLKEAVAALDAGTYVAPSRLTLGEWLDIWLRDYLGGVKPFTVASYTGIVKNHLKPSLGAVRLESLNAHTIQRFYNNLGKPKEDGGGGLSAKSVKNVHGVLHKALQQAVLIGYLRSNPTDACILPRAVKREIAPLDETQSRAFLEAIQGSPMEDLFAFTLFTGLREGEVLGLTWDCVDFQAGVIRVEKQLQREKKKGGAYIFAPLKNDRVRTITPAPWVMELLRSHRAKQSAQQLRAGEWWETSGLVFTNELGGHLAISTVYKEFKRAATSIGRPDARFHDLRHSYAVAAIRSGDDIKTVQGNLGHATAAFTLDVYGHVTDQMKQESAQRMERYIKDVMGR
ncbi:MAG: site-specific integrase [Clostridiales bacterium]|nr:site-specific integrase [Clostridiales bacterium]